MKPEKLKIGDEIRVIAPSRSMCILNAKIKATEENINVQISESI